MNQKEVLELKKRFTKERCTIQKICGVYVDPNKNKQAIMNSGFLSLDENIMFKYMDIAKKTLSGRIGDALLNLNMNTGTSDQEDIVKLLLNIKDKALDDKESLELFYDRVIDSYDTVDPYYIILFYDAYDIPGNDGDDSEDVYTYILCSICPAKMSKPGLGYFEAEDKIDLRIRDWVVQPPVAGFLYPSFNGRNTDVDEALFFNKKPKAADHLLMDTLMCCNSEHTKTEKREAFNAILVNATMDDRNQEEKIFNMHETLRAVVDEREATDNDAFLSGDEIKDIAKESGFDEDVAETIAHTFADSFESEPDIPAAFLDQKFLDKNSALKEVTDLKAEVARLMQENIELKKKLEQ